MTSARKSFGAAVTAFVFAIIFFYFSAVKVSAVTYPSYKAAPSSGNVFCGISGEYEAINKDKILAEVNRIRKEAYDEGLVSMYVPVQWSQDLEKVAKIRAAETATFGSPSHERPNGEKFSAVKINGAVPNGENIAYFSFTEDAIKGIQTFYFEKQFFDENPHGSHYGVLINPIYTHIGVACFRYKGQTFVVDEQLTATHSFSGYEYAQKSIPTGADGNYGKCTQIIEVPASKIRRAAISGKSSIKMGNTASYTLNATYNKATVELQNVKWSASSLKTASVSGGTVKGVAAGKAVIKASSGNYSASKEIVILSKGTKLTKVSRGKKKFTAHWSKQNVDGYQLQYSRKGNFSSGNKSVTISNGSTGSKAVSVVKGKWYVRIRTYQTVNGKRTYSPWSGKKAITVK